MSHGWSRWVTAKRGGPRMTTAIPPAGGSAGGPSSSGLADVIDTILDKGLVIDAYVRLSLVGIELITIDARIVIASVDTYLRFAQAANRLQISTNEPKGLADLVSKCQVGWLQEQDSRRPGGGKREAWRLSQPGPTATTAKSETGFKPPGRHMTSSDLQDQGQMHNAAPVSMCTGSFPLMCKSRNMLGGVGDPPTKVDVIREGDIAALVSERSDRPPSWHP